MSAYGLPATQPELPEAEANAVLVGGPLAGRAVMLAALDRPAILLDSHGIPCEYRPSGAAAYRHGQRVDLKVFAYFGAAD